MYCQFLGRADIASFFRAPSAPSFLMKFGIWAPNMIIFVLVHGFGGWCLVQKFPGNGSQSELKLPGRSENNFLCDFNHSYFAICTVKLHKIFTTCFHTSLVQDPMVGIWKKNKKIKPFCGQCSRIGSFEWFLEEECQRTLGVKMKMKYFIAKIIIRTFYMDPKFLAHKILCL